MAHSAAGGVGFGAGPFRVLHEILNLTTAYSYYLQEPLLAAVLSTPFSNEYISLSLTYVPHGWNLVFASSLVS